MPVPRELRNGVLIRITQTISTEAWRQCSFNEQEKHGNALDGEVLRAVPWRQPFWISRDMKICGKKQLKYERKNFYNKYTKMCTMINGKLKAMQHGKMVILFMNTCFHGKSGANHFVSETGCVFDMEWRLLGDKTKISRKEKNIKILASCIFVVCHGDMITTSTKSRTKAVNHNHTIVVI